MFKPVKNDVNFPDLENQLLKHWYEHGIVDKYLKKNNKSKKTFSFLDGPITANNPMGVHHAWGRTYKDLWPKFFNLLGYRQRFQNGFDCQGLWVEVEVEKELGLRSKKDIENLVPGDSNASIAKFVQLCKDRVLRFSKIQTEQSKRLGYFADWDHSYFTMSDENNYMIWHFLKVCYENGWIYKGHESVPWCPRCETAISQHEMLTEDYKEVVHESIYFKLRVKSYELGDSGKEYLLVWTTTPWTIPANIAVAVDKDFDYSLVESDNERYWVAQQRIKEVFKDRKVYKIIKTVKGSELVGLKYENAFDNLERVAQTASKNPKTFHTVVATDQNILPITLTEGTGLVHTAVSAGVEDFKLGKKYKLPMIPVIADNADYLPGLGFLSGKNAKKNPRIILDFMKDNGWAYHIHQYKHRYPACWRCKKELVWKVEDEWYISMDRRSKLEDRNWKNKSLKERMIEVTKKIKWLPEFGLDRELDWLKNMHDWLISKKNRYWGLALPVYECKSCGSFEIIGSYDELKQKAVMGWKVFEGHTPHKPYIDEVAIKCKKCGKEVKRINDVGNPWLDAGIVAYSTIKENNQGESLYLTDRKKWKTWFPADFITESFPGQFKNWFYSLIAMSTVLENTNPFKRVLGFGTLLGEDGRPMHKSWGNSIEFKEGAEKIGVDVMRWMFARQNPADNMLFGYKKADEVRRQFYLILWNIYKFFVEYANLDKPNIKYQISNIKDANKKLNILDQWILSRFYWLVNHCEKSLREFNVKDAALETEKFVSDLSTWYIRRSRDRVFVNSDNSQDKSDFYQTLYLILSNLAIILSPIMPFVTDIIYTNLTGHESVHLSSWPDVSSSKIDLDLIEDMGFVRSIVEVGHKVRKEQKLKLKQPLQKVSITLPKSKKFILTEYQKDYLKLIQNELNTKNIDIDHSSKDEIIVVYDTTLTDALINERKLREFVRTIQEKRKQLGVTQEASVDLVIPSEFEYAKELLKKKVIARSIKTGQQLEIMV